MDKILHQIPKKDNNIRKIMNKLTIVRYQSPLLNGCRIGNLSPSGVLHV